MPRSLIVRVKEFVPAKALGHYWDLRVEALNCNWKYFSPGIKKCTPKSQGGSSRFGLTGGLLPTNLIPLFAAFTYFSLAVASKCLNMRFLYQKHLLKTLKRRPPSRTNGILWYWLVKAPNRLTTQPYTRSSQIHPPPPRYTSKTAHWTSSFTRSYREEAINRLGMRKQEESSYTIGSNPSNLWLGLQGICHCYSV